MKKTFKRIVFAKKLQRIVTDYRDILRLHDRANEWRNIKAHDMAIYLAYWNKTKDETWMKLYDDARRLFIMYDLKVNDCANELIELREEYNKYSK